MAWRWNRRPEPHHPKIKKPVGTLALANHHRAFLFFYPHPELVEG
jgi:hypothetical protein